MGKPWSKEAKRRNRIRRAELKARGAGKRRKAAAQPRTLSSMGLQASIPLDAIPERTTKAKGAARPSLESRLLDLCLRQAAIIDMLIQH